MSRSLSDSNRNAKTVAENLFLRADKNAGSWRLEIRVPVLPCRGKGWIQGGAIKCWLYKYYFRYRDCEAEL
jgi:hypothetical protein